MGIGDAAPAYARHVISRRVERNSPTDPHSAPSVGDEGYPFSSACVVRPSAPPLLFLLLQLVCLVA